MLNLVREAGLDGAVQVESAGTGGWHAGERADPRSRATARRRGVVLESRACRVTRDHLERCDYVLAMDGSHLLHLRRMAAGTGQEHKVHLLRAFDPESAPDDEVPDPYYGGARGFDEVFDVCEAACRGLLEEIRRRHGL